MRRISMPVAFIAFIVTVAFSVVAGLLVLHGSDDQRHHVQVLGQRMKLTASESIGHQVFAQHCAVCHQLAASNSVGAVGPNLDYVHPTVDQVEKIIENGQVGAYGVMPAQLATGPDISAVAQYVAAVSRRQAYTP